MGNVDAAWCGVASAKLRRIEALGMVEGYLLSSGLGGLGDAESEAPKALRIAKYLGTMSPGTEWRAPKAEESM